MADSAQFRLDLLTIVGARPQFIKSAAVTRQLGAAGLTQRLVHSGQHADHGMGLDFLMELGVAAPDAILPSVDADRTSRLAHMMRGLSEEIRLSRPKAVLVYGDTDTTLAGALAAHHAGVMLVHVEAGLRSGDRRMPEEHIRIMVDQLSDLLFTTGPEAGKQLFFEGTASERIVEVGDVMLDVAVAARPLLEGRVPPQWPGRGPVMVVTAHRAGLVDAPEVLMHTLSFLGTWVQQTGGAVYFPVHPRTRGAMASAGWQLPSGVVDPGPLAYLDMQAALLHADVVLTDSGGVQKEAWFQGTPAVILRDTTEWQELLAIGASRLFDPMRLVDASGRDALHQLLVAETIVPPVEGSGLFGEGKAAVHLVQSLRERLYPAHRS